MVVSGAMMRSADEWEYHVRYLKGLADHVTTNHAQRPVSEPIGLRLWGIAEKNLFDLWQRTLPFTLFWFWDYEFQSPYTLDRSCDARKYKVLSVKVTRKDLCVLERGLLNLSRSVILQRMVGCWQVTNRRNLAASTPAAACSKRSCYVSFRCTRSLIWDRVVGSACTMGTPHRELGVLFALSAMILRSFQDHLRMMSLACLLRVTIRGRIHHVL